MMQLVVNRRFDGSISINFIGNHSLNIGDRLTLSTNSIKGVTGIDNVVVHKSDETAKNYLSIKYRYKNNPENQFSNTFDISTLSSLTFLPCFDLEIEFHIFRVDDAYTYTNAIKLKKIELNGSYLFNETDTIASLSILDEQIILKPKDVYKIFKLDGYEIISDVNESNFDIKYRFTQNDGRTYTNWEVLTQDNIRTVKIDPLRFAKVEYLITNKSSGNVNVFDILLLGNFQNVSANYLKLNRYGLKEDCMTYFNNLNSGNTMAMNYYSNGLSCYVKGTEVMNNLINSNKTLDSVTNFYKSDKLLQLNELLTNAVSKTRGWIVDYYRSDPDENGIDYYLHEQTLSNIVEVKPLRIIVPENKFKNETLSINIANLDLFDTFEIQIVKNDFKTTFGVEKRPRTGDILYICPANMIYRIKHSQAFRGVMNASTYYKIYLEKYENSTSQQFTNPIAKERIQALTADNVFDNLFKNEILKEDLNISNKKQLFPTSFDNIRHFIHNKTAYEKENLYNGGVLFSKAQYNLSKILDIEEAIIYSNKIMADGKSEIVNFDNVLKTTDNKCISAWFNIPNLYNSEKAITKKVIESYDVKNDLEYDILSNNTNTDLGYRLFIRFGKIIFKINADYYEIDFSDGNKLYTNIWYNVSINLDQRNGILNMKLLKRNSQILCTLVNLNSYDKQVVDILSSEYTDLIGLGYVPVDNEDELNKDNIFEIIEDVDIELDVNRYEYNHTGEMKIYGSGIKLTNIRVFNDLVEELDKMLSQEIIVEASKLIIADNANKKLTTTNYFTNNFR